MPDQPARWRSFILLTFAFAITCCAGSASPNGGGDDGEIVQLAAAPASSAAGRQCIAALRRGNLRFEPRGDVSGSGSCGIQNAVLVARTNFEFDRSTLVGCALAHRMAQFERAVIQPLAQRHFRQRVARVEIAAGYACRAVRNSGRISQHALGNAIDMSGFILADGTAVSIGRDFRSSDSKGRFLREVALRACGSFAVVLTPDSDADHALHFHFDIGPSRHCGAR
jgi:hypothetical protein